MEVDWIVVDGSKNMPLGWWLVRLENDELTVAHIRKNVRLVGGNFDFDRKHVTHYCALPDPPSDL